MKQFPKSKKFLGRTLHLSEESDASYQYWSYYDETCPETLNIVHSATHGWQAKYEFTTPNSSFEMHSNWVKTEKSARRYVSEAVLILK